MDGFENVTSDGGLKKKIVREGYGPTPKKGQKVQVIYEGYIADTGKLFDVCKDKDSKNSQGFEFNVGNSQVIKGWDMAVIGMKLKEESEFWIRSDYAYGKKGSPGGVVPPNSDLKFRVELRAIK